MSLTSLVLIVLRFTGVIFFEMCYKPLHTTMERITILTSLRKKEIILPQDFVNKPNKRQEIIVRSIENLFRFILRLTFKCFRWLLSHDISKRPTSQELLQSEHVPPPVLEERELQELVRHTLSNPQLKGYKYLIASCFNQKLTPAQDITYDKDPFIQNVAKPALLYDFVKEVILKVSGKSVTYSYTESGAV